MGKAPRGYDGHVPKRSVLFLIGLSPKKPKQPKAPSKPRTGRGNGKKL